MKPLFLIALISLFVLPLEAIQVPAQAEPQTTTFSARQQKRITKIKTKVARKLKRASTLAEAYSNGYKGLFFLGFALILALVLSIFSIAGIGPLWYVVWGFALVGIIHTVVWAIKLWQE